MNTKAGYIILILICAGLVAFLIYNNKQSAEQKKNDQDRILTLSNQLVETSVNLDDYKKVNLTLEGELTKTRADGAGLSNNLNQVTASLTKTEAELKTALEEMAKRDAKIAELESQKEALDKQAIDLKTSIGSLEGKIADTQKKLAASEGDKAFLEKELKRLMAEKAELERQFNDLAVLRAQVSKLKEELSIARRLDWIRQGLYGSQDVKGAQRLMQSINPPAPRTNTYDLNVEVNANGTVKVISPKTNAPAPPK